MKINYVNLKKWCECILKEIGINKPNREIFIDTLLEANLRGKDSHGITRLPVYIERIKRGLIKVNGKPQLIKKYGSVSLYDGDNELGQIIAYETIKKCAIEAIKSGISVAGVKQANHFGMAAYYSEIPTKKGMIGFICCNAAPVMAPCGINTPILGTNPLSVSIPTPWDYALTFDMATTVLSRGKIRQLDKEENFEELALSKNGYPAKSAEEALEGTLLPLGGYKGFGLALIIDIIAGVLTGSMFSQNVGFTKDMKKSSGTGFFVGALNIESMMDFPTFYKRLGKIYEQAKYFNIRLPGDNSQKVRKQRIKEGIPLKDSTIKKLITLGEHYGHAFWY